MSEQVSGRRDGSNIMVTTGPDVLLTPMGSGMVPVAYSSVAYLDPSERLSRTVRNNANNDFQLNSRSGRMTGHEPGTGKGVVVPGHMAYSHVKTASSNVFSEGWAVVRNEDPAWMNHPDVGPTEPRRGIASTFDCSARLREARERAAAAARGETALERNRGITQAYRELAGQAPNNQWIRLASYVSAQSGCAMQTLGGFAAQTGGRLFFNPSTATDAIGAVNGQIFNSIYPWSKFVAQHGATQLRECAEREGWRVPPRLQDAFDQMERGELREAADQIARYEQQVVTPPLYNQYRDVFQGMENANSATSWATGDNRSIPLSYACGSGTPVPFSGSILNDRDRVNYYNRLMNTLLSRGGQ